MEEKEEKVDDTEPTTTTDDNSRDMVSEDDTTVADAVDNELESDKVQDDESQVSCHCLTMPSASLLMLIIFIGRLYCKQVDSS